VGRQIGYAPALLGGLPQQGLGAPELGLFLFYLQKGARIITGTSGENSEELAQVIGILNDMLILAILGWGNYVG
jgi:hypothetical protein